MKEPELEENAYLAAIVGCSNDAIISMDLTGTIRSFNTAAERLFGYAAPEIIGESITRLIPSERQDEEMEVLARLRRGERVDHYKAGRLTKDGRRIEVSLTLSPLCNSSGTLIGASTIAREIIERRRAGAAAHLAAIVETTDDAIISKDLHGTVRSFNAAAERMFGYAASEIIGKSITILIPTERQDEEKEILAHLRRGERVDHYETVRVAKDGRRVDVSLTVSPLRNSSGVITGASKIARNITERKQAAEALAEQQEWFRVTLNSIGDAVIASGLDGRVTFLNHEAERLTGWSMAEAKHQALDHVFRVVDEETQKPVDNPAARVLQRGAAADLPDQTALISRDGIVWPIADGAAPIVDRDGKIIGVVLVFREITEARKAEELERERAAERERLLQDERAARGEAERANRVKDDFVAMVSHELRTPLNAILGWTQLLRKKTGDATTLEHGLEVIARNTRLQAQLIADLLDVSRIVSGKLLLELERVDLAQVVLNGVEALQAAAAEKGVALVTRLDPDRPPIAGDPARIQQIVWNLVSNAIKFTPKGGTVNVTVRNIANHAEITVTDTGMGILPEFLPKLFERFRQDSTMTTRRHGGLGLGLSITKHLTELHGGSVRAWSAGVDQGSTFTVELPFQSPKSAKDPLFRSQEHDKAVAQAGGESLRNIKVLVVEDDQDTRDLVRRLLEAHRAEVVVTSTAPEALELVTTVRPDILVSDIGLPNVDGYELVRRIRQMDDAISNVPAVALTAFARYQDRDRALGAGFNAHVAKPVEPAELVSTLGSFVSFITSNRNR